MQKQKLIKKCIQLFDDMKSENVVRYGEIKDYIVEDCIVLTAMSEMHARSIAQKLQIELKDNDIEFISSSHSINKHITPSNKWIVVDCSDFSLMIHVMIKDERLHYGIDSLLEKMSSTKEIYHLKNTSEPIFAKSFDNLDSVEIIDNDDFDVSEDDIKSIMFNAKTLNAKKAPVSRSGKKAKSKTKRSVGRPKKSETKEPKKRGRPKKG
jgi:ribosomal silencing factor RsfS